MTLPRAFNTLTAVFLVCACLAAPAAAQTDVSKEDTQEGFVLPSGFHVVPQPAAATSTPFRTMTVIYAALHTTDMVTTAYSLSHPSPGLRAIELNPLLNTFQHSPVWLVTASSSISITQSWVLSRMHRRHPKLAMIAMTALAATEGVVLANNLRVVGQLRAAHTAGR